MFVEKHPIHPDARDFTMEADADRALLFIHGFTGTPYHFKSYAGFFHDKGMYVRAMRLPGHGSHIDDLVDSSYLDWRQAVRNELKELAAKKKKVFIVGYSFGANLALDVAMHYQNLVAGLILLSPPVFLKRERFLRFLTNFYHKFTNIKHRPKPLTFLSKKKSIEGGGYSRISVKGAVEFFDFIDKFTKQHLAYIDTPCLILSTKHDPLVSYKSAEFIYNNINSRDKELVSINGRRHTIKSEDLREKAYEKALEFILKH